MTHAMTQSVVFEGRRVTGVRFLRDGRQYEARTDREVLLAAGSINSPQLLELSGIGRPDVLHDLGIDVVHASQGVGENLQDHLQIRTVYKVSARQDAQHHAQQSPRQGRIALQYALMRRGLCPWRRASSACSRNRIPRARPRISNTMCSRYPRTGWATRCILSRRSRYPSAICARRASAAAYYHRARPAAGDPAELPFNAGRPAVALRAVRQARRIMTAKALERYRPKEILPGPAPVGSMGCAPDRQHRDDDLPSDRNLQDGT